jgi:exodeoxyribonuclease V alpha subunit
MNAHRINAGKLPDISNGRNADFFFMDMEKEAAGKGMDAEDTAVVAQLTADTIVRLVKTNLPKYYHTPSSEIQVLTPMQRGVVGATNLNQALQAAINPGVQGLKRGGYIFKAGDKVMQIRNNYDKEVFNGDIGTIADIDLEERNLRVIFDDRYVEYDISELDELVLAYATTIHKSQGSEYPIVVIPVLMNHYIMLQRNLIYTGITRAKKILVLVGSKKALGYAVRNVTVTKRNTMLKERLQKVLSPVMKGKETNVLSGIGLEDQFSGAPSSARQLSADRVQTDGKLSHEEWLKIDLFTRLSKSDFRNRFHLRETDKAYIRAKGMETIRSHAEDFVRTRLAPAVIPNDGKQTPMKGHPVFLGQHATGTCCRGCLYKWHGIPAGRELTRQEQKYVVDVLMEWINREQ